MKKTKVGILFGGRSAEHEVSLQSAKSVLDALDTDRFRPVLIGIDREGHWYTDAGVKGFLEFDHENEVALFPKGGAHRLVRLSTQDDLGRLDVVFPVLHGPYGEDGSVQGLLKLANIPFVGASVLGSAVGMDKDVMKRLLRDAGINISPFFVGNAGDTPEYIQRNVEQALSYPVFVKPANLGSSVGINKAKDAEGLLAAIKQSFRYDTKIIVEKAIKGREIECSVIGNRDPIASELGEIKPAHEFYSYDAKYLDENGAELIIPAKFSEATKKELKKTAIKTFSVLCCAGMARVDMFLTKDNKIFVNEINTIPGFTSISMYPKLWEASGLSFTDLISRLIELGIERHREENALEISVE